MAVISENYGTYQFRNQKLGTLCVLFTGRKIVDSSVNERNFQIAIFFNQLKVLVFSLISWEQPLKMRLVAHCNSKDAPLYQTLTVSCSQNLFKRFSPWNISLTTFRMRRVVSSPWNTNVSLERWRFAPLLIIGKNLPTVLHCALDAYSFCFQFVNDRDWQYCYQ